MNRGTLRIQGRMYAFSGPSAWSELRPHQAVSLIRFRGLASRKPQTLFPVLELLYGLRPKLLQWLFDPAFLQEQKLSLPERENALLHGEGLVETVFWCLDTLPSEVFLVPRFRLFDFQYGTLRVLWKRLRERTCYVAPSEGLGNCTFGEFMYAEGAHQAGNLAKLAAVLYRPRSATPQPDDARTCFDARLIEERTRLFNQLDPALLALIELQYEACKRYLLRCFPLVFSSAEPDQKPQKAKSAAGWLDIAINMAKLDVTKIPLIEQQNLYLALKVLNEEIRQAEELEEQLEKLRRK